MKQIPKNIALQLLRAYKFAISPCFGAACRYQPTCSEYAMEAVDRYGVARGSLMAIMRVLRCNPLAEGGLDPVVQAETGRPNKTALHLPQSTDLCSH